MKQNKILLNNCKNKLKGRLSIFYNVNERCFTLSFAPLIPAPRTGIAGDLVSSPEGGPARPRVGGRASAGDPGSGLAGPVRLGLAQSLLVPWDGVAVVAAASQPRGSGIRSVE